MAATHDITVNDIVPYLDATGRLHVRAAVAEYKNLVYESELKALRSQVNDGPPALSAVEDTVAP